MKHGFGARKDLFVYDKNEATPFRLKADAEKVAFAMTLRDPDLISNLKIELL